MIGGIRYDKKVEALWNVLLLHGNGHEPINKEPVLARVRYFALFNFPSRLKYVVNRRIRKNLT
jgi:hypothetical protein